MSDNTADEARKGLGATLAGKAKEVVGAVLGNDSLAAEGQLQQAEAAARKDASTKDAIAHAEAEEAAAKLSREREIAEQQVSAAVVTADVRSEQVLREGEVDLIKAEAQAEAARLVELARIDADTRSEVQQTQDQARQQQDAAARREREAEDKHAQERASAEAAEQAAARAREDAERLAAQTR